MEPKAYSIRVVLHRRALKFSEPYTDTVMSESLFLLKNKLRITSSGLPFRKHILSFVSGNIKRESQESQMKQKWNKKTSIPYLY
jgi:hypothetical protein